MKIFPRLADKSGQWMVSRGETIPERQGDWSMDPTGLIRSIENVPASAGERASANRAEARRSKAKAKDAAEAANRVKGFEQQDRLDELNAKIADLEATLRKEAEGKADEAAPDDAKEMRGPAVANLNGDELGPYDNVRDLGKKAHAWYRENLQGTSVTNASLGRSIRFTARGGRKVAGRR